MLSDDTQDTVSKNAVLLTTKRNKLRTQYDNQQTQIFERQKKLEFLQAEYKSNAAAMKVDRAELGRAKKREVTVHKLSETVHSQVTSSDHSRDSRFPEFLRLRSRDRFRIPRILGRYSVHYL
eukprot:COSAG05_NODE_2186_length_3428_cov_2.071493_6_plen_122_part_00